MKRDTLPRLIQTAYDWHSGQSSPLYSFASTGGVIWSADHGDDLIAEISNCLAAVVLSEKADCPESRRLVRLMRYVTKAKIGYCYTSGRMMPRRKVSA